VHNINRKKKEQQKVVKSARRKKKRGGMFQFYHSVKHRDPKMKKRGARVFFTGFGEFCCNLPTDFAGFVFTNTHLFTATRLHFGNSYITCYAPSAEVFGCCL